MKLKMILNHADSWFTGAFVGNGELGACIYYDKDHKNLSHIRLGHTGIYDNRPDKPGDEVDRRFALFRRGRLPVGEFHLTLPTDDQALLLDIGKAEAIGRHFRVITLSEQNLIVIDHSVDAYLEWVPSRAFSPRQKKLLSIGLERLQCKNYEDPRPAAIKVIDGILIHSQPYFAGGGWSLAWAEKRISVSTVRAIISIREGTNLHDISDKVFCDVQDGLTHASQYIKEHHKWWKEYFEVSSISLPSKKWQDFWHIQMYKLASATRADKRIIDTLGPWLEEETSWPAAFWNLNVQLTYQPLYTSGHIDIAQSLSNALKNEYDILINNVPENARTFGAALGRCTMRTLNAPVAPLGTDGDQYLREYGNLTWALFCVYTQYRVTMDYDLLHGTILPLLIRSADYGISMLNEDNEGILHLPASVSPEYGIRPRDCTYALSLLRWSLHTLIAHNINKEKYISIQDRLVHYAQDDKDGIYIGEDVPLSESHRHYSHMLMFSPLHLYNTDDANHRTLLIKTLNHFKSMPASMEGYSLTGIADFYLMLGEGDKALSMLRRLRQKFITPNTMYFENGGPVLETPISAAGVINNMLMTSHDGTTTLFPALPKVWKHASFKGFLAEGAFQISAEYKNGRVFSVIVKSLKGGTITLRGPGINHDLCLDMKAGEEWQLKQDQ